MNDLLFRRLEQEREPTNIATMTKQTPMIEHTRLGATSRERFMQAAEREMAKFERWEMEFRKKDREERAAELQLPLPKGNHR